MAEPTSPVWRQIRTAARLAIGALLVAACSGPAATVVPATPPASESPFASAPAPTASALPTQAAAATQLPTVPPVTTPPVTTPPITAPPITPAPTAAAPAVGVALPVGDQQLMTVLDAEPWPGTTSVKPASGKAFFTVRIRIDALATTSWDSADFKLLDTAGKSYAWRPGRSPHLYDGADMTIGNNYVGWITYEIPKASLVGLTLVYKPKFLTGITLKVPVS